MMLAGSLWPIAGIKECRKGSNKGGMAESLQASTSSVTIIMSGFVGLVGSWKTASAALCHMSGI